MMRLSDSKVAITLAISMIFLVISHTAAAIVDLQLIEPEKFSDIVHNDISNKRSIALVNKEMIDLFERLAKKHLPQDNAIFVSVTNIDLAGKIEYMLGSNHQNLRVVRDTDIYRLSFRYELKNQNGETIKKGEKQIKNFLSHSIIGKLKYTRNTLGYFEKPLDKWFKEEFSR